MYLDKQFLKNCNKLSTHLKDESVAHNIRHVAYATFLTHFDIANIYTV